MKILKKLSILLLILSFHLSLKGQSKSSFDTINFKILRNLKTGDSLVACLVSQGCFHLEQRKIKFKNIEGKIIASLFYDVDYRFYQGVSTPRLDSVLAAKVLNKKDLIFCDAIFKKSYLNSKLNNLSTTSEYFTLYQVNKGFLKWTTEIHSEYNIPALIERIEK
jgi:hypothetical protein